jgi:hypothetical protein
MFGCWCTLSPIWDKAILDPIVLFLGQGWDRFNLVLYKNRSGLVFFQLVSCFLADSTGLGVLR